MTTVELSANQARELTDRIKVAVEATWELIKEAYQSSAWRSLGYPSWDDYCTREFGTSRIKLPREERQEVVSSMREIGMSTRAIASATGVSYGTAHAAIKSGDQNRSPESEPSPVVGTDGKTYTPKPRLAPVPDPPQKPAEAPAPEPDPAPSFDDEPDDDTPEWEDVGTIPKSRLNDVAPPRPSPPAPGFNACDLDELNQDSAPSKKAEVHKPLDEDYHNPKEHLIDLMSHLKKASKAIEDAIFTARHIDSWKGGPLSGDLRELLDQLDSALDGGSFDAELVKLLEGEK